MSSIFFLAFKHELTFENNEERDINMFIVSKQNKLSFFFPINSFINLFHRGLSCHSCCDNISIFDMRLYCYPCCDR